MQPPGCPSDWQFVMPGGARDDWNQDAWFLKCLLIRVQIAEMEREPWCESGPSTSSGGTWSGWRVTGSGSFRSQLSSIELTRSRYPPWMPAPQRAAFTQNGPGNPPTEPRPAAAFLNARPSPPRHLLA